MNAVEIEQAISDLALQPFDPAEFPYAGAMIQAGADDEERGALGMHYTSVPNILKVLNPLFLDDLREKLADGGRSTQAPRACLGFLQRDFGWHATALCIPYHAL